MCVACSHKHRRVVCCLLDLPLHCVSASRLVRAQIHRTKRTTPHDEYTPCHTLLQGLSSDRTALFRCKKVMVQEDG